MFSEVALLPRCVEKPDARLLASLNPDVIVRANEIQNDHRKADLLWTRLLLLCLAKKHKAPLRFKENPPYSPRAYGTGTFFTTISHTSTFVGAGLATSPLAIDIEVMRTKRPLQAISKKVFGEAFWGSLEENSAVRGFYEAWGVHECAVKLGRRIQVQGSCVRLEGTADHVITHTLLEADTLLTVVHAVKHSPQITLYSEAMIRERLSA